jgi:Flp pilus assembly protein protease CpaA
MVGSAWFSSLYVIWICQVLGALMVVLVLFYISKRLHEQMEEVASLRQLLDERENAD